MTAELDGFSETNGAFVAMAHHQESRLFERLCFGAEKELKVSSE